MSGDVGFLIALVLLVAVAIHGIVTNRKAKRQESADDEPGFDDWKEGSPNDPLPDDAKPIDLNGTDKLS